MRAGQLNEAERLARETLRIDPHYPSGKLLLGSLYARTGRPEEAADLLIQVLDVDPDSFEAVMSLAALYREGRRLTEAIDLSRRALELRRNDVGAICGLGRCYLAARNLDEAAATFAKATALMSNFPAGWFYLGKTRQLQGWDGDAANCFSRAAALAPNPEHMLAYGQSLLNLCDYSGAADCAARCLHVAPGSAAAHLLMCGALIELGRLEEADRHLQQAIALDPEKREALQIAARQRPLGYIQEANESLRTAIAQNPRLVAAYDSLMQNQRSTERDRDLIENMRQLLAEGGLAPTETAALHYGLGKGLEDLGEYESSMAHYDEANAVTRRLKFGDIPFDKERYATHVKGIVDRFVNFAADRPSSSSVPILVVGMMRSGTTLVEQILSSHSDVAPAGEQLFWSLHWEEATAANAGELGNEYVAQLRNIGPGAKRVTDKMPGNYLYAGLILRALPEARIVHIRRSPIDTCLSIWTTPSHMPHDGAHEKGSIVFVYRQYLAAMERYRQLLPPERFLEIDYETLTADPETTTRKLLAFCDLPWDQACLSPEKNRRIVNTPSAWQVRQPVYRSSVERWRRFEPWLAEFCDLL